MFAATASFHGVYRFLLLRRLWWLLHPPTHSEARPKAPEAPNSGSSGQEGSIGFCCP